MVAGKPREAIQRLTLILNAYEEALKMDHGLMVTLPSRFADVVALKNEGARPLLTLLGQVTFVSMVKAVNMLYESSKADK